MHPHIKNWDSCLKEYRRYALLPPETKRDRRTDIAITICLPKFLWGQGGIKKTLLMHNKTSHDLAVVQSSHRVLLTLLTSGCFCHLTFYKVLGNYFQQKSWGIVLQDRGKAKRFSCQNSSTNFLRRLFMYLNSCSSF